jgi:DNA-binding winged helix-turn-helix (wHTH) protein
MESSTTLPRKYFVVVTHSSALQLELEELLSNERYNSFGTAQAKMFVEGVSPPSSAPKLMEFFSPHLDSIVPSVIKRDTQRMLSSFESEWRTAQPDTRFSNSNSHIAEASDAMYRAAKPLNSHTEAWRLSNSNGALIKDDIEVVLTGLEATLVKKMLNHEDRVVSKDDLIRSIGREPEHYRGLEMCLSRLQEKFKNASNGERLFRAVRNRGYCLIQNIIRGKSLT